MRLTMVAVRLRVRLLRLRILCQSEQSSPHFQQRRAYRALSAGVLFAVVVPVLRSQPSDSTPAWIHRSDAYSAQVVRAEQQLDPEADTSNAALDDQITDLSAAAQHDATRKLQRLLRQLQAQRRRETDLDVREDLDILIDHVQTRVQGIELEAKFELPYVDATEVVLGGISALLDDQIAAKRQPTALVRLRKYAGLEPGIPPLTQSAQHRLREALANPNLLAPARPQVERNLAQANRVLDEVAGLFEKYHIGGYEKALTTLRSQIAAYNEFIRKEVLPRCPIDRRLPPELYAFRLRNTYGVDMPPSELAKVARAAFRDTQAEMQALAGQVADTRHLPARDYRSVIRALKRDQLHTDAIVTEYARRLDDINHIIEREKLITLPPGAPHIRLATTAEGAYAVAPQTNCPPTRTKPTDEQQCETVLPVTLPAGTTATQASTIDDYTFAAASWTLAAHEIRPGHELQYDAMIARGVSRARMSLGVKLANPEGWALYAEYLMRPYMPPDARLISLQFLLLREARAFLDADLQAGLITGADALSLLKDDVVLSDAFAVSEVRRLANAGSGTAYFYGYSEFLRLRKDVEQVLGARFDQQRFHDFVMAQGKIPIPIIRHAILERFLKSPS
jgi:uncharacterized protein (DUF885 family)